MHLNPFMLKLQCPHCKGWVPLGPGKLCAHCGQNITRAQAKHRCQAVWCMVGGFSLIWLGGPIGFFIGVCIGGAIGALVTKSWPDR